MSDLQINIEEAAAMARMAYLHGVTHEGARDLNAVFGYKEAINYEHFYAKARRQDVAGRIVTAYPDATWSSPPSFVEDESTAEQTALEKKVHDEFDRLGLWDKVRRADILAQKGRYSIIYFGMSDGFDPEEPLEGNHKINFLSVFGEKHARIKKFDKDITSERFGKPELYEVTVNVDDNSDTHVVHHSRVVHICERNLESEIYGQSILELVYDRLDDLNKVIGGAAETFWLNARGGLHVNADKDVEIPDPEKTKEAIDSFVNQMSRVLRTKGMDAKMLNATVASPKDHADSILQLISGATGIPKRILVGSEQGELASSQDQGNWSTRIDERRHNHCEPRILRPIVDKMQEIGFSIPEDYSWEWPPLSQMSEKDKADISKSQAQAIATYSNAPEADSLITPRQFVEDVLHLEYREDELDEIAAEEELEMEEERKAAEEMELEATGANPPASGEELEE